MVLRTAGGSAFDVLGILHRPNEVLRWPFPQRLVLSAAGQGCTRKAVHRSRLACYYESALETLTGPGVQVNTCRFARLATSRSLQSEPQCASGANQSMRGLLISLASARFQAVNSVAGPIDQRDQRQQGEAWGNSEIGSPRVVLHLRRKFVCLWPLYALGTCSFLCLCWNSPRVFLESRVKVICSFMCRFYVIGENRSSSYTHEVKVNSL